VLDYNHSDVTDEFHTWNGGIEGQLTFDEVVRVAGRGGYYYDPLGDIRDFTIGAGVQAWMVAFDVARIPQARGSGLDPVVKITVGIHMDLSAGGPSWRLE
jgi:hypothetical protein